MAVLEPVKLTITNYPDGQSELLDIENNPVDENAGTRKVSFSKHLWVEKEDFMEVPANKYKRLYPGNEVRLKGAYLVTCTGCIKDEDGNVTEILCEYDPLSKGGNPADGRKVKGATIHWTDMETAVDAEVRIYDRLFTDPDPDGPDKDFVSPRSRCPKKAGTARASSSCARATSALTTNSLLPGTSSSTAR